MLVSNALSVAGGDVSLGEKEHGPPPAIELRHIHKSFGAVHANKDVHLFVRPGTIHGIVGENGAGKSTLMSILYGFYEADSGDILVDGRKVRINSSQAAIDAGIGMVHQHFMLVDTFTVLENVMLGAESGPLLRESADAARRRLAQLADDYGLRVAPDKMTGDLPVGEQQRVEILKTLYRGARVLILDEPTGVLTPQETEQLFRILAALKKEGVTIILITHKLREIMAATDYVSVMRGGEMVAHRHTARTSKEELAELMVGRRVNPTQRRVGSALGEVRLSVEKVSVLRRRSAPLLKDIGFSVRAGEIVGIAGVSGNGQSALLEVLSAIRPIDEGRIVVNGREITPRHPSDPAQLRALKVAHVPEDRHRLGLVARFSAMETAILGYHRRARFNRGPFAFSQDLPAIERHCRALMERFDIRPPEPFIKSANMSGGNQQKLILAREIDQAPTVLLVGQPTRGVDIGAIEFIHRQLLDLRDQGCAIVMVSVELDEIMALSDRILVMFDGRIVHQVDNEDADIQSLGLMMTNAYDKEKHPPAVGARGKRGAP